MTKKVLAFLMALLPLFGIINAQDTTGITIEMQTETNERLGAEATHCLSVSEFVGLVHMSLGEIRMMLGEHGYKEGYFDGKQIHVDTVNDVVLKYGSRIAFDDIDDETSVIWIFFSKDGLGNIVTIENGTGRNCNVYSVFNSDSNFFYERVNHVFHGSYTYNESTDGYLVKYENNLETGMMKLTIKDTTDIMNYVKAEKAARRQRVQNAVDQAVNLADKLYYITALGILDSLISEDVLDEVVTSTRSNVAEMAEAYYFTCLDSAVNVAMHPAQGILFCDTLLMFSKKQDSVSKVREILIAMDSGEVSLYSTLRPEEFEQTVKELESVINDGIRYYANDKRYFLKFDFTIHTDTGNSSFGNIELLQGLTVMPETEILQQRINSIADSGLLSPIFQNGIYTITHQELAAKVSWTYQTRKITNSCNSSEKWLSPYVDNVKKKYFWAGDKPSIPTRCVYTLGLKEKECDGKKYTDVELVSFKTSSFASWMPSLIIPGLGTKIQGDRSNVSGRFIPFLLFAAIGVGGLYYENHYQDFGVQRVDLPDDFDYVWQIKNIGYALSIIGFGISSTIYINEIVEGISNFSKNQKRSARLRKELKRGPIRLQTEDIKLTF